MLTISVDTNNDPTNKTDPTGLRPDDWAFGAAGLFPSGEICGKILFVGGSVGVPEPGEIVEGLLAWPAFTVEMLTTMSQFTTEQLAQLDALLRRVMGGSPSPIADVAGAILAIENDALRGQISTCATSGQGRPVYCVSPAFNIPPGETVALTIGHFIFCEADKNCTNQVDIGFLDHELVHVDQWERFGDLFFVLYGIASAQAAAESFRTGERYDCVHGYEGPAYRIGGPLRADRSTIKC